MKKNYTLCKLFPLTLALIFCFNTSFSQQQQKNVFIDEGKPYIEGQILVQLHEGISPEDALKLCPQNINAGIKEISKPMRAWLITFDHQLISHDELIKVLSRNYNVFSVVQNDYIIQHRATVPNDPQFNQQWHHVNTNDADIDSDEAWDITTGGLTSQGDEIVVAIMEGVNLTHTDLIANRWANPHEIDGNGIDDDGNGYIDDIYGWNFSNNSDNLGSLSTGHGTSCAGMIGATGNNNTGVAGINWNVKMLWVGGFSISQSGVIQGYTYPLNLRKLYNQTNGALGAFVVATSASWGIDNANPNSYPLWCQFYDTLGKYGIINIAATTNNTVNVDVVGDMPTACASPFMIGVGRSGNTDNIAGGYGVNTIEFPAPGINVRTTANTNTYTTTTGTSFACPLTAGVAALIYSIPNCNTFITIAKTNPQQASTIVRQALMQVDPKPNMTNMYVSGGRLNAKKAVDYILNNYCSSCVMTNSGTTVNPTCTGMNNGSITLSISGCNAPYTYSWNTGATTSSISNLAPGNYSCTVTASGGETSVFNFTLSYQFTLNATITKQNVTCNGGNNGTATANITGGTAPYSYVWNTTPPQNTQTASNLMAGTYQVTATDANGCQVSASTTITQPNAPTTNFSFTTNQLTATFTNSSTGGGTFYWTFGDGNNSTQTNPVHTYATSGAYNVCLQHTYPNSCGVKDTCKTVNVINTSLEEIEALGGIITYPNPANNIMYFAVSNNNIKQIDIFDVSGKVIISLNINSSLQEVDVSALANGMYFYQAKNREGINIKAAKFIISK